MFNVLLVDDERWARVSIRHMVEQTQLPFRIVHECSHGKEALDYVRHDAVDLIMSDIRMPVMDGLSLAAEIRHHKHIHMMMLSGYNDFPLVQQAMRYGVEDYILKPVDGDELKLSLQRFLDNKGYSPNAQSTIQQILRIIQEAMPGDISLQEVADKVHLNSCYISQLFKKQMNQKFVDYVLEQRIEEAKRLLARTSLRVAEVAGKTGYTDIAYFCNTFKRQTGVTPSEYRKSVQEGMPL
ncbi:response regulator [Paenibacillus chartarius]|uniref:Response regulator n=1 Tax=Paenibacillus chartarius TaxID=747481 RepID=A0ABV6DK28_9BACL